LSIPVLYTQRSNSQMSYNKNITFTLTCTLTHSLFLSCLLSLYHTHTRTLSLSHTHTHTLSLSLSLSNTHTLSLSQTHTLSLSHTHSHSAISSENNRTWYHLITVPLLRSIPSYKLINIDSAQHPKPVSNLAFNPPTPYPISSSFQGSSFLNE
jgi:outer membrane usher protein FimD/PapC